MFKNRSALILFALLPISCKSTNSDRRIFVNSIGMEFVRISPGVFTLGTHEIREVSKGKNVCEVEITKAYYIGKTEVTQGQWETVMGKPRIRDGILYPVRGITWNEANEFCKALSVREKKSYRLPTEAEWEHACKENCDKYDDVYINNKYQEETNALIVEKEENPHYDVSGRIHKVIMGEINAYGLRGMNSNAWEWCYDWYGDYPTIKNVDYQGPTTGKFRVIRGGQWPWPSRWLFKLGHRESVLPETRDPSIGFRVIFTAQ